MFIPKGGFGGFNSLKLIVKHYKNLISILEKIDEYSKK